MAFAIRNFFLKLDLNPYQCNFRAIGVRSALQGHSEQVTSFSGRLQAVTCSPKRLFSVLIKPRSLSYSSEHMWLWVFTVASLPGGVYSLGFPSRSQCFNITEAYFRDQRLREEALLGRNEGGLQPSPDSDKLILSWSFLLMALCFWRASGYIDCPSGHPVTVQGDRNVATSPPPLTNLDWWIMNLGISSALLSSQSRMQGLS